MSTKVSKSQELTLAPTKEVTWGTQEWVTRRMTVWLLFATNQRALAL